MLNVSPLPSRTGVAVGRPALAVDVGREEKRCLSLVMVVCGAIARRPVTADYMASQRYRAPLTAGVTSAQFRFPATYSWTRHR